MPARIIVRAELASLLAKSQGLTDANRLRQLGAEQRRREDIARLAAKKKKADAEATRRKQLEDHVMRTRRTAAMGQRKKGELGTMWIWLSYAAGTDYGGGDNVTPLFPANRKYYLRLSVASGDGLVVENIDFSTTWVENDDPRPSTPGPTGQQTEPLICPQFFPAPDGGILYTLEVREGWLFDWPEIPATGIITPGALLGSFGVVITDTTCSLVTPTSEYESGQFAQYSGDFYPDFGEGTTSSFYSCNDQVPVLLENGVSLGVFGSDSQSAFSPNAYAINSTWKAAPTSYDGASITYDALLAAGGLSTSYSEAPLKLASTTAAPSTPGTSDFSLVALLESEGYGITVTAGGSWSPILAYDPVGTGYVAAQYGALVTP